MDVGTQTSVDVATQTEHEDESEDETPYMTLLRSEGPHCLICVFDVCYERSGKSLKDYILCR